tara:strand:+ start:2350 stop:2547 length:198 start_codon:yes stop_codon:yes gene_type:complete
MEKIDIEGTIDIDGQKSKFSITNDINDGWYQWGATSDRLSESVYIVDALQRGLLENVSLYNEEEE